MTQNDIRKFNSRAAKLFGKSTNDADDNYAQIWQRDDKTWYYQPWRGPKEPAKEIGRFSSKAAAISAAKAAGFKIDY